jgi:hypothetical protein
MKILIHKKPWGAVSVALFTVLKPVRQSLLALFAGGSLSQDLHLVLINLDFA